MSGTRSPSSTDPCDDTSCMWTKGDGSLRITLPVTHFLNGKAGHHVGPRRRPRTGAVHRRFALLSSCSPIESGGAAQLPTAAAPTNVGSAVQYAVLTARQNSSECARVDPAALSRWLLVHVTFDSTLGFPGEGPPKKGLVRSLSRTAH